MVSLKYQLLISTYFFYHSHQTLGLGLSSYTGDTQIWLALHLTTLCMYTELLMSFLRVKPAEKRNFIAWTKWTSEF